MAVPNSNGVTGTYGVNGTEYRTEMDSFVKVVQSGGINDSNSYFTVYKADGTSATYGFNANSRFSPSGLSTALSWKVTQESYSNGANTIDYEYDTSVAGEHLLGKIYYTGSNGTNGDRRVEFTYVTRSDVSVRHIAGGKTVTRRKLSQVNTYVGTNNIAQYKLSYQLSSASTRTLLKDIKQCAPNGYASDCTMLTTFNWLKNKSKVNFDSFKFYQGSQAITPFSSYRKADDLINLPDVNGDGTLDYPGYLVDAEQKVIDTHSFPEHSKVFDPLTLKYSSHNIDLNQDGLTDYINVKNQQIVYQLNLKTHVSAEYSTNIRLPNEVDSIIAVQDLNGDGKMDIVTRQGVGSRENYHQQKIIVYWHTGNSSAPFSSSSSKHIYTLADVNYQTVESVSFIGDADNNGLVDLAVYGLINYNIGVTGARPGKILYNNGQNSAFSAVPFPQQISTTVTDPSRFDYLVDINGDGLIDWLYWSQDSNAINLLYRINLGNRSFSSEKAFGSNVLKTRYYSTKAHSAEPITFYFPKYLQAFKIADTDLDGVEELLVPGQLLLASCANVYEPNGGSGTITKKCGDELYGQYRSGQPGYNLPIPLTIDKSLYQYDALHFSVNADNETYSVQRRATDLIGTPSAIMLDAFGDGLLDMMSAVYRSSPMSVYPNWNSSNLVNNDGIYLSRNYGSGTGNTGSSYQPTDYLESVTDGLGNSSQWRYRPLSTGEASAGQNKLYSTDHNEVGSGYVHFASSMYVVQSFKQSNGQGGLNNTQYAYKGAMYNYEGRGFGGFNQIWEKDMQRDKTVHSTFKQKFPEVGLLTSQKVSVAGVTVQQTTNTWADNPQHSVTKVYHNILTKSVQQSKDLTGTALSTQESLVATSDVDQWGNVKKRTQKTTDYIKGQANTYESVTETLFNPDTANWWLNKFSWTETRNNLALRGWGDDPAGTSDKAQWQRQTVNTWNETHKQPVNVTYSASGSSCNRVEATSLNAYGLPTAITVTGQSSTCVALSGRQTSITYTKDGINDDGQADDGYLPHTVTNAKSHITTTKYDMGLGLPIKVTAPNSIVTQTEYDAIGRPVQVKQTGSPTQYLRYLTADNGANLPYDNSNSAVVMTRTSGAGQPETEQYFDAQGRVLRIATQGFNGGYQYQDKHYDALGRLLRESIPYGNGTGAEYTEFSDFDALDRPKHRSIPNGKSGLESTYTYDGLTTNITVGGRTMSRTYGSQGWLYETVDAGTSSTTAGSNRFAYDSAGRPLVIQDANEEDIIASYNGFGHKTKVVDPNQGAVVNQGTVFGYNSLGELDKQTDANGVVQTYALDTLGRITSKVTTGGNAPGTATYVWDAPNKLGLLSTETENGVSRAYSYTSALQLASTTVTVDGVARTIKHQYDSFYGRPKALEYPNGLTLKYAYNDYGYLEQTSNAASGYVYRSISDMDEAGHITGAKLANNLMTESRSYNGEGTMGSVEVTGPLGLLHGHYYDGYDDFMNLISERNGATGLTKVYSYDSLNRLSQYRFNGTLPTFNGSVDYAYDKVGNFLKKTDYSANSSTAYRYGGSASCAAGNNAGPNAVCQLTKIDNTSVNFQYDNRGNLRVGDGLTMTYNAMDKPLTITGRGPGNTTVTSFVYGSDGMRAKQSRTVSGVNTTTYYVDKYYEVDSDGSWRAYLDDIAVLSYSPARQHLLHFTLRDRLGSGTTMVDQNGVVISRRYFDPFGKTTTQSPSASLLENIRRMTYDLDIAKMQDLDITNKNRRGFTDHEHLNEQQLIHMNGRVYDYNLGRFMSVDPLIQAPTSTQSVNPYSYIMNNPLAGTDPTGYKADYLAGAGFGFGSNLTDGQVNLLNQAERCSFCSGEFAAGVNFSSDFKASYKATGSLLASAFFIAKSALPSSGADSSIKTKTGQVADIGAQKKVAQSAPEPDGGFTADLSKTKAKTRSGHTNAGNKQLHEEMTNNPEKRKEMEGKHGDDVFDRTSTSNGGRRNPQNAEWDHNSTEPNKLDLRTKGNHAAKTRTEKRGGFANFHQSKATTGTVRVSGRLESLELKKLDKLE